MLNKIAIHGVPRSGTSWIGALFDSSTNVVYRNQPLFSYAFKSFLTENSDKSQIQDYFNLLNESNDDFLLQTEGKKNGLIPVFKKLNPTHIIYKEARYHHILRNLLQQDENIKVIGVIRNPKSVISSWVNAPKEFHKEKWNLREEWKGAPLKNKGLKEEFYGYNKWKEVANLFLSLKEEYPKRFYLLNYIELLNETEKEVKQLFNFCNLEYNSQTRDFIEKGQKIDLFKEAYSVYRINQVDDKWKVNLPIEIITEIDNDLKGTNLEKFIR